MASLKKSHASSGSSHSKAAKFKRYLPLYLMFLAVTVIDVSGMGMVRLS